jgi:rhodanese-related sulfurtransferase
MPSVRRPLQAGRQAPWIAVMVQEISPSALAQALASGEAVRLLDVRQPWESQLASLPGSLLIPLNELPRRAAEVPLDAESTLVVYCHHGIRSLSAADYLQRLGHTRVRSLAGGIDAWSCAIDPSLPRY